MRTLTDGIERIGRRITENLEERAGKILRTYGFDSETGLPQEKIYLESVMTAEKPEWCRNRETLHTAIETVNASREEKIPYTAEEVDIESDPLACVYISIDEVGVKHQKISPKTGGEKGAKCVENTVIHIQQGQDMYVLTAPSMKNVRLNNKPCKWQK